MESYNRQVAYTEETNRLAIGYGHSTRWRVCGPYRGSMNDYPYTGQPRIGWTSEEVSRPCVPSFHNWNYWGPGDSCATRPPITTSPLPAEGATDCQRGCLYRSVNGALAPTGDVCNSNPPGPEKGNECD